MSYCGWLQDESIAAHLNQLGLDKTLEGPPEHFPHPYQHEIEAFEVPSCQLQAQPEQLYLPLDQVTCTYIDTYEPLKVPTCSVDVQRSSSLLICRHLLQNSSRCPSLLLTLKLTATVPFKASRV
jgi:hypothetical protein